MVLLSSYFAGLINAAKVVKKDFKKLKVVISGAGAAGSCFSLLSAAGAKARIIMLDRAGTIYAGRPDMTPQKAELAAFTNPQKVKGSLAEAMRDADVFIGVSRKKTSQN